METIALSFRYRAQRCRAAVWFHPKRMFSTIADKSEGKCVVSQFEITLLSFLMFIIFFSNLCLLIPFMIKENFILNDTKS